MVRRVWKIFFLFLMQSVRQNNKIIIMIIKKGKNGKAVLRPISYKTKKPPTPLPYVELCLSTWVKDSHGLYDYEADSIKYDKEVIKITKTCKIYRHVSSLRTRLIEVEDEREMPVEEIYLATVIVDRQKGIYKIQSATVSGMQPDPIVRDEHPDLFHNCYLVIREYDKQPGKSGYPLIPGNIIKLGRVEYIVLEVKDSQKVQTFKQASHLELNTNSYAVEGNLQGTCKVCLCDESTEDDPLINPCVCKGSCEFIHVNCLKNWINSKVKKELNQIVTTFNFSKFQCEICKAPFPKIITMGKGETKEMITIEKPSRPYIILESLNDREQKKQRNLHLISPEQGCPLKIGRGHQSEIRVNDISVSRSHAQVRFEDNKFYIKDLKSKFGTLIKFKEQFAIKEKITFQYGRVCLGFKLITELPKQESDTNEDDDFYH